VVGLEDVRVQYAMVGVLDGHGRLELIKFHAPPAQGCDPDASANTRGIRHVAFVVPDLDAVLARVQARGAELVGDVERYGNLFRLCYVHGSEGIIIELAERLG
jgi:predicted enzyme related to lactoylglutathione lyase